MSETITYKIQIDNDSVIDVGSNTRYSISSLALGQHTFKVIGTCQHAKSAEKQITFTNSLAANTLRFRFSQASSDPSNISNGGTWKKVTNSSYNDWDWTCTDTNWSEKFKSKFYSMDSDVKVVDAGDTSSVTNMSSLFYDCTTLTSVVLFDTSNVTSMKQMFQSCVKLTEVPLFNTSNVTDFCNMLYLCKSLKIIPAFNITKATDISYMCAYSENVESGMLDFYNVALALGIENLNYSMCFSGTGTKTNSGKAERVHIPTSWGGDGLPAITTTTEVDGTTATINYTITNGEADTWVVTCSGHSQSTIGSTGSFELTDLVLNTEYTFTISAICEHDITISTEVSFICLAANSLKIEIADTDEARTWVENQFNSSKTTTRSFVKLNDTQYIVAENSTNWHQLFEVSDGWNISPNNYLTKIIATGNLDTVTNIESMFSSCIELNTVCHLPFNNVTHASSTFFGCKNLTAISIKLNEQISDITSLFHGCTKLTNISGLNNLCNLSHTVNMFYNCESLVIAPELNLSKCQTASQMFQNCKSLTTVPPYNTPVLSVAENMFAGCSSLTTPPDIDYSHLEIAPKLFSDCTSLTSTPYLTSNLQNITRMFQNCTSLTTINTINLSTIINFPYLFEGCTSLVTAPNFDFTNVTDCSYMFYNCTALTQMPTFTNTNDLTSLYGVFEGCTSLKNIKKFDISNVTRADNLFYNCVNVESGAVEFYNELLSTGNVTSHSFTFKNCGINTATGSAELAQIPSTWGGTGS